jgi:hypothetical protein
MKSHFAQKKKSQFRNRPNRLLRAWASVEPQNKPASPMYAGERLTSKLQRLSISWCRRKNDLPVTFLTPWRGLEINSDQKN